MLQLKNEEKDELVAKCDRLNNMKHSHVNPYVFTEQGVYMLSSVLKSKQAIEVERKSDKQYKKLTKALEDLIYKSKIVESKTIGFIKPEKE